MQVGLVDSGLTIERGPAGPGAAARRSAALGVQWERALDQAAKRQRAAVEQGVGQSLAEREPAEPHESPSKPDRARRAPEAGASAAHAAAAGSDVQNATTQPVATGHGGSGGAAAAGPPPATPPATPQRSTHRQVPLRSGSDPGARSAWNSPQPAGGAAVSMRIAARAASGRAASTTSGPPSAGAARLPRAMGATRAQAKPAAPPRPPLDPQKLEAQVRRGLAKALRERDGQEVTIRLRPAELGVLKISVRVDDAHVTATIRASSEQAQQLLHESLAHLREALEARQLSVDRLVVEPEAETVTDDRGREQGRDAHAGGAGAAGSPERGAEPESESDSAGAAEPRGPALGLGESGAAMLRLGTLDAIA